MWAAFASYLRPCLGPPWEPLFRIPQLSESTGLSHTTSEQSRSTIGFSGVAKFPIEVNHCLDYLFQSIENHPHDVCGVFSLAFQGMIYTVSGILDR